MKAPTIERFSLSGVAWLPATANPEARTIEVRFLSGLPIQRVAWDGRPFELVFDPDGGDLSRLNSGAALVLNSHQDRPLSAQIGIVERAWRDGATFKARIRFSARADVEPIWQSVLEGTLRGISGGFHIADWVDEEKGGRLVRRTATKWEVIELSLVSVAADAKAYTLAWKETTGENRMIDTQQQTGAAAPAQTNDQTEVRRVLTAAALGPDFDNRVLELGLSLDQVRTLAFEEMQRRASPHETRVGTSAATVTRDSFTTVQASMTEALIARCSGKAPAEIGRQWHGRRVADMARELLASRGVRAFGSDSQIISEALMHSSSDFPNLLSGLASKVLLDAYQVAESGIKQVARKSSAPDFKTKYVLRRGEYPALERVPEHGEFTHGAIGESKESYAIETFGKIFSISRQGLVNDDLGAFTDLAFAIGQAAADYEANYFVTMLTSNAGAGPVMSDSVNLFDNAHGNSGSGVIGMTALDAARTAMRTQKGLDGVTVIDCRPKFLLVPASRETVAQQYITQITPADSSKVNPFVSQLVVIAEPRLDAVDVARWYLFADPAVIPAMEYSYLNGVEGPEIQQRVGFEVDGLELRARLDFGAAAVDWRACYVSTGS